MYIEFIKVHANKKLIDISFYHFMLMNNIFHLYEGKDTQGRGCKEKNK